MSERCTSARLTNSSKPQNVFQPIELRQYAHGIYEGKNSNTATKKPSKQRNAKVVSVNPVRTGYSAIADEWVGIRPGTDGLFVMALIHELLRTDRVDAEFLVRHTNAHWLVIRNPGGADDGLFVRDADGKPQAWDRARGAMDAAKNTSGTLSDARLPGNIPRLDGTQTSTSTQ